MLLKAAPKDYVLSLATDIHTDFAFVDVTVSTIFYAFSLADVISFISANAAKAVDGEFCEESHVNLVNEF